MPSLGGQVRPFVGNPIFQQFASGFGVDVTVSPRISGHGATGIGGAVVSGNICHSETGFLELRFSGTKIWVPYWTSS